MEREMLAIAFEKNKKACSLPPRTYYVVSYSHQACGAYLNVTGIA